MMTELRKPMINIEIVEHISYIRSYTRNSIIGLLLDDQDAVSRGYTSESLNAMTDDELAALVKHDAPMSIMEDMDRTADTIDTQWEASTGEIETHWWEKRIGEISFGRNWWNEAGERLYKQVLAMARRHVEELDRLVKYSSP